MIYHCIGTVAWRAGRPFTRIGRAKRVGRPALQATVLLTEDSNGQRPTTLCFVRKLSGHNSGGVSDIKYFLYRLSKMYA